MCIWEHLGMRQSIQFLGLTPNGMSHLDVQPQCEWIVRQPSGFAHLFSIIPIKDLMAYHVFSGFSDSNPSDHEQLLGANHVQVTSSWFVISWSLISQNNPACVRRSFSTCRSRLAGKWTKAEEGNFSLLNQLHKRFVSVIHGSVLQNHVWSLDSHDFHWDCLSWIVYHELSIMGC